MGNLGNWPVTDFRKFENWWGEFLQVHVGNCPVADLKNMQTGREFLQAHVGNLSNSPVADFGKSTNGGNFYKHM